MAKHSDETGVSLHVGPTVKRNQSDTGTPIVDATGSARRNINLRAVGATWAVKDDPSGDVTNVTLTATGSGHIIREESTPLTARTNLSFIGAAVTATDNPGADSTDITIAGGGFTLYEDNDPEVGTTIGDKTVAVTDAVFSIGRINVPASSTTTITVNKGASACTKIYHVNITPRGNYSSLVYLEPVVGNSFPKTGSTFTVNNNDTVDHIIHFEALCS